jgi:hypothetical protein
MIALSRRALAVAALGLAAPVSASAQIVGIGSNPQGTLAYSAAAALGKAAADVSKLQARVQPSAGPSIYMPQIDSGELETGIVTLLSIHEYTGRPGADAKKPHNIRLAIILFPLRAGILVRRDSSLRTVADLRGKRVTGEFATQINSLWMAEATLASAGLSYADVSVVPAPHVVRGIEDFAAGRADAAFFSLGAAKVAEVNAQVSGGVRFLSVEDGPRTRAAFAKHAPGSYVSPVTPSPALAGIVAPTNVLATDLTMIAGAQAPDEVIYKLVKSAYEKRAELGEAFPPFREMTPDRMVKQTAFAFHPGAIRAYQEIGVWPPKE